MCISACIQEAYKHKLTHVSPSVNAIKIKVRKLSTVELQNVAFYNSTVLITR